MELGDQVLFSPEDRYEVEVGGEDYLILRERDIHAVAAERIESSHRAVPVTVAEPARLGLAGDRQCRPVAWDAMPAGTRILAVPEQLGASPLQRRRAGRRPSCRSRAPGRC